MNTCLAIRDTNLSPGLSFPAPLVITWPVEVEADALLRRFWVLPTTHCQQMYQRASHRTGPLGILLHEVRAEAPRENLGSVEYVLQGDMPPAFNSG